MTLSLQMLATLDARGVEKGAAEARREIGRLGTAIDQAAGANDRAAASATRSATAHVAAAAAARRQAVAARNGGLRAADATRLSAHEVTNLSYQMNDIAVGLASGQSPFTIMAQQGLQVSQIMGRRGLGQIIPAIGTSLLSLVSPTTLVLAGITAVGYGASAVFSAMRKDVTDTDAVVERHTELIRKVREAYDDASQGARRYGIESTNVLEALRRKNERDTRKLLQSQLQKFLDRRVFQPGRLMGLGTATPLYGDIIAEINVLKAAVKSGEADIAGFRDRIAELSNSDRATDSQRKFLNSLLETSEGAVETSEKLKEISRSLEEIGEKTDRVSLRKFLGRQTDHLNRLRAERNALRHSLTMGDTKDEADALRTRHLATIEAGVEITRRNIDMHSEEADRIREAAAARAEATIMLELQKTAYERLLEAREAIAGQNDHIARLHLETALVGASNVEREQQIALLEAEQDIREHRIDPGGAVARQLRQAAARRAAAEARLEEASLARELARSHGEDMQRLRLEALLIGRSNDVRARAIALLEAEQEIRRHGIDVNGRLAETIRDNARALAGERAELERHRRAWGEVERAGTGAIDRITDGIASGDIGGALEAVAGDLTRTVLRLSTANPLKNALYGTNLPTLADTGGVGGFLTALTGGGPDALRAASMNVQAATVILNGDIFGSPFGATLGSGAFPPAPGLPGGATSLLGGGPVASQAWDFFSGRGLKDFQVAAILGHMRAESNFNPLATGDGGNAFGLFQWNDRRRGLLDFLGGRGNPGNVGGQLQYAWKELMTSESRSFRNLTDSTGLRDATAAVGGFLRPAGFSFTDPEAMHNWTGRLQFAGQALRDFGNRATGVTGNLGSFGDGLGSAAASLAQGSGSLAGTAAEFAGQSNSLLGQLTAGLGNLVSGLADGGGGNWLSQLFGGIGGGIGGGQLGIALSGGAGLYDRGGYTGAGDPAHPAGIVHEQEFVFDAPAVRRLGVPFLEALRSGEAPGYRDGGAVSATPLPFPAGGTGGNRLASPSGGINELTIRIIDRDGKEIETQQARTANGVRIDVALDDIMGGQVRSPGSNTHRALVDTFDLKTRVAGR